MLALECNIDLCSCFDDVWMPSRKRCLLKLQCPTKCCLGLSISFLYV